MAHSNGAPQSDHWRDPADGEAKGELEASASGDGDDDAMDELGDGAALGWPELDGGAVALGNKEAAGLAVAPGVDDAVGR